MQVALLGPLEVRNGDQVPVEVGGRRVRTLLALLALQAGQVVTGATLIDRIWGDHPPEAAPNALQALVSRLRRRLPDGLVESHPAGYRLAIAPDAVDVLRFEQLVATGSAALATDPAQAAAALGEALALWRGSPLIDLADAGRGPPEVARLAELRATATEDRAAAGLRLGHGRHHVAELETLVAARPTRERAAALLIRALCADGRGGDALSAYERTRAALADQLGVDPSPELTDLHRRLLREDPALLAPPAPVADAPRPHHLRAELTSFVGRDDDLARVGKLVAESRLTTLTGPGGSGKTRLAVESARALLGQAPDGVWLVELAPLTDGTDLPHAVLAALGLRSDRQLPGASPDQPASHPVDRLEQALAARSALLVLDNCEHLVAAVAALAQRLLGACPGLRILATSREPLGVTGEALWPVEPLGLPPADRADLDTTEAMGYAAVRLLADRAGAVRPGFAVDDQTVTAVVRICRALDGMPLAIELAAARLRTLTPDQLAERLDDRFRLLTNGSRTALPRHQTLRAVVDWSWDLLEAAEQALLRRLAYFSGGASVAAVEQVCSDREIPAEQVLDLLTALADKSLLVPQLTGTAPRYRMLETIKAYGLARLAEAGEEEALRRAHAAHFVSLAETAEPRMRTGEQGRWLVRLAEEHDNLQAALRGAIAAGDTGIALRLVAALGWYWSLAGHRREGLQLAIQALAMPGEAPDEVRALAYAVAACDAIDIAPEADTEQWFVTAAQLAARTDLSHPMLRLVGPIAAVFQAWSWGGNAPPPPVLETLYDDPDPWVRATARNMRVHLALQAGGYRPELVEDVAAALADYRLAGDRWGVAFALSNAAELATLAGDLDTAVAHHEEAVALLSLLGIPEDKVLFQVRLAELRWIRGDRARAEADLVAAGRDAERIGMPGPRTLVARAAGDLARLAGDLATARARLDLAQALATGLATMPEIRAAVATALGQLATAEGQLAAARAHHTTALELALAGDSGTTIARSLVGLADLAMAERQPERAAELLGASVAVRGVEDWSLPDASRIAAAAGEALGDPVFAEAYARGHHTSPTVETIRELAAVCLPAATPSA